MWCFEGEELDLLQRHEITTAEKSFMCHSNFTQGSHVVEVDDAFRNNTVHVEPFMSRYIAIYCIFIKQRDSYSCVFSAKFYRFIRFLTNFLHGSKFINKPTRTLSPSMNKEYKERFQDNMPQTHATYYTLQFLIQHLTVILRRSI